MNSVFPLRLTFARLRICGQPGHASPLHAGENRRALSRLRELSNPWAPRDATASECGGRRATMDFIAAAASPEGLPRVISGPEALARQLGRKTAGYEQHRSLLSFAGGLPAHFRATICNVDTTVTTETSTRSHGPSTPWTLVRLAEASFRQSFGRGGKGRAPGRIATPARALGLVLMHAMKVMFG